MNGICEIELGGQMRSLKFGNYALEKYIALTGSKIGEMKEVSEDYTELDMYADVIYAGLYGWARSKQETFIVKHEEVVAWMDDLSFISKMEAVKAIHEGWIKVTNDMLEAFKQLSQQSEGEEKKK